MNSIKTEDRASGRLFSAAEFAVAIGKTERQVYRYINSGRVKALSPEETGLSGTRIPESELEAFLPNARNVMFNLDSGAQSAVSSEQSTKKSASQESAVADGDSVCEPTIYQAPVLTVPLERHENAVMQLGYLQRQVEQQQKLLTDGSSKESNLVAKLKEIQAELDEAQREIIRLTAKAEVAMDTKSEAESQLRVMSVKLEDAERRAQATWWQRLFN